MINPKPIHEVTVQEGYARWAAQYDSEDNALIVLEEELTIPLLATIPAARVLDIGTGTGRYAVRLAKQGAQVMGLDQSQAMLAIAHQNATHAGVQVQLQQHSLEEELPCKSYSFDLVIAALVLCHIEDWTGFASEAYRVLRPGGHILVTDFHPEVIAAGWRTRFDTDDEIYHLPTAQHTVADYPMVLRDAGFQVQTVQDKLVRDLPEGGLPADLLAKDGDKAFCLVILASKPGCQEG